MADSLTNSNREDEDAESELTMPPAPNAPHLFKTQMNERSLDRAAIDHFYSQIRQIPSLDSEELHCTQLFIRQLESIQQSALDVIKTFEEQKTTIIRHYDFWLQPIAKEALEELVLRAEELNRQLSSTLESKTKDIDWNKYLESWLEICEQWQSRKALSDRILALVSDRIAHSIDNDIKVLVDYQNHQIAGIDAEEEKRESLKNRLDQVTDEPLKQLRALRHQTHNHDSLLQAAQWMAAFQEKRESCFDQLLVKIDTAVKEIVDLTEKEDVVSYSSEDEGEIVFMEREFESILVAIDSLSGKCETDFLFTESRLESLLDHLDEINLTVIPHSLQRRVLHLKNEICFALDQLYKLFKKL